MATEVYKGVTLNLPGNPQPNGLTEYNALKAIIDMADGALPATVKFLSEYASLDAALTEFGTDEVSLIVDVDGAITASTNLQNVDLALFLNGSEITGAFPLTINRMSAVPGYDPFDGPTVTYGADVESFAAKALTIRNNNNDAAAVEFNLDRFIDSNNEEDLYPRLISRVNIYGATLSYDALLEVYVPTRILIAKDDIRLDGSRHTFREFLIKTEYYGESYADEYALPLRLTAFHDDASPLNAGIQIAAREGWAQISALEYTDPKNPESDPEASAMAIRGATVEFETGLNGYVVSALTLAADGSTTLGNVPALATPATTFLTSDSGTVKSRTAAEALSDIETLGKVWASRTSATDNDWRSVCYGNGLFVAVASFYGAPNRVMTSPDGINWTSRTSPTPNSWLSVCYGNGLFVAVANTGTGNRVMTSPDGINWTSRTSAADNDWFSVCYGNGLFVAVAESGTGNRVMTSPDGINWTIRTSAANNYWRSVCYGNGLFVAVASSGVANRVMTSPDGINWTSRTSAADNSWFSVCYGNGLFVAVANTGTGNRVMTSPDGINWTSRTSAADNYWHSVCYGNGLFVAVAYTGTGNRVMTSGTPVKPAIPDHDHSTILKPFGIGGNPGATAMLKVTGQAIVTDIPALATAATVYLTSDGGTVKSRTAAEVEADIIYGTCNCAAFFKPEGNGLTAGPISLAINNVYISPTNNLVMQTNNLPDGLELSQTATEVLAQTGGSGAKNLHLKGAAVSLLADSSMSIVLTSTELTMTASAFILNTLSAAGAGHTKYVKYDPTTKAIAYCAT